VAFIMDGNGRWARRQGFARLAGHEEGANSLRTLTRHCRSLGIPECTFFALSTENFTRRPRHEVHFLLGLLKRFLIGEREELTQNNIRLKAIGRVEEFPDDVRAELETTEQLTEAHDGMVLRLALNYGARQEILDAVNRLLSSRLRAGAGSGGPPRDGRVSPDEFVRHLYDPEMSDPDLLIRTAGESRLSNFLLWQLSYAELWVTPALWPDFGVPGLEEALEAFRGRVRKFGAIDDGSICEADEQASGPKGFVGAGLRRVFGRRESGKPRASRGE